MSRNRGGTWRVAALAGVALMVAATGGCGDVFPGDEVRETERFAWEGDTLRIESDHADVHVLPGAGDGIEVERRLRGQAATGGNASWTLEDGTLRLTVKCEGITFGCGGEYHVRVPENAGVDVESGQADVRIKGVERPSSVETRHGDITVDGAAERLRLESVHGDVRVDGAPARVTATAKHGDVRLVLTEAPESVVTKTSHGDILVGVPAQGGQRYQVTARSEGGDVISQLTPDPDSPRTITADSTNGDVRLERRRD